MKKHNSDPKGKMMLFSFMERIIRDLRKAGRIGTANNYRATLKSFSNFLNGKDIPVSDIDSYIAREYEHYLKTSGLANNSISFYMRILRAVYNRSVKMTGIGDTKPFSTVFTGYERTRKRAISFDDIKRLRTLDLDDNPELAFSRDIFIFLFLCRGMSFVDASFLRKSDTHSGVITYQRRKTRQKLQIRIVRQIEEIIKAYTDPESLFLLPIITKEGENERRQYETTLRKVNKNLKKIGEMASITIPLSTYVARHSWATIAKTRNIPVNVISDALGHDSLMTTQIYLDSIDSDIIDKANDTVIKGL